MQLVHRNIEVDKGHPDSRSSSATETELIPGPVSSSLILTSIGTVGGGKGGDDEAIVINVEV